MSTWEEDEAEAREAFLADAESARYGGELASMDRQMGAREGWDAAIKWAKARVMRKALG